MDKFSKAMIWVCFLFFGIELDWAFGMKRMQLDDGLTRRIEGILEASWMLHQGLTQNEQDKDKVEGLMTHIKNLVISAKQASFQTATNTLHLRHILSDTERALEQASLYTQERQKKQRIKRVFDQLVLLSQTYKLSSRYPVYFCAKDRSVWLQKTGKIRNPIHPQHLHCGSLVN